MDSKYYPVCEFHYFQRLDLICETCNNPITSSFIEGPEICRDHSDKRSKKYHVECFRCEYPGCTTVLSHGHDDSNSFAESNQNIDHSRSNAYYTSNKAVEVDGSLDNRANQTGNTKVYCEFHYASAIANRCHGCKCPLLKDFIQISGASDLDSKSSRQIWHPECYLIYTCYGTVVSQPKMELSSSSHSHELYLNTLKHWRTKIRSIWMTISEFEELVAEAISDLVDCVTKFGSSEKSNRKLDALMSIRTCSKLIDHICLLFEAADSVESAKSNKRISDSVSKEIERSPSISSAQRQMKTTARKLAKNMVSVISSIYIHFKNAYPAGSDSTPSQLSQTAESSYSPNYQKPPDSPGPHSSKEIDLVGALTEVASLIKVLIKSGLKTVIELDRQGYFNSAVGDFLNILAIQPGSKQSKLGRTSTYKFTSTSSIIPRLSPHSDSCHKCHKPIEEQCIYIPAIFESGNIHQLHTANFNRSDSFNIGEKSAGSFRWHYKCFKCSKTGEDLSKDLSRAVLDRETGEIFGKTTIESFEPNYLPCGEIFQRCTLMGQYGFLIRVGARRLYGLLNVRIVDDQEIQSPALTHRKLEVGSPNTSESQKSPGGESIVSQVESLKKLTMLDDINPVSISNEIQHISRPRQDSLSSYDSSEAPDSEKDDYLERVKPNPTSLLRNQKLASMIASNSMPQLETNKANLADFPGDDRSVENNFPKISSADPDGPFSAGSSTAQINNNMSELSEAVPRTWHISQLSALELFVMNHGIVGKLQVMVRPHLSDSQLLEIAHEGAIAYGNRKTSLMSKFLSFGKRSASAGSGYSSSSSRSKISNAAFGCPLSQLNERCGVETKFGFGLGSLIIPVFIENAISTLMKSNLAVEGIFRKNGNIKHLAVLESRLSDDPKLELDTESPIQLAALIKKFLRDLPEPLLTYRLYRLFLLSQKMESREAMRKLLHYTCCLLPKPNRDLLEVVIKLIKHVSLFSNSNKMDITNLATVLAPNILYRKIKEKISSESAQNMIKEENLNAIQVLKEIVEMGDAIWVLPEEICELLTTSEVMDRSESMRNLSSGAVIKLLSQHDSSKNLKYGGQNSRTFLPKGTVATILQNGRPISASDTSFSRRN